MVALFILYKKIPLFFKRGIVIRDKNGEKSNCKEKFCV